MARGLYRVFRGYIAGGFRELLAEVWEQNPKNCTDMEAVPQP